jgi:hypothetical protein
MGPFAGSAVDPPAPDKPSYPTRFLWWLVGIVILGTFPISTAVLLSGTAGAGWEDSVQRGDFFLVAAAILGAEVAEAHLLSPKKSMRKLARQFILAAGLVACVYAAVIYGAVYGQAHQMKILIDPAQLTPRSIMLYSYVALGVTGFLSLSRTTLSHLEGPA